jgi:integrase
MPKKSKPWWRQDRGAWFVQINRQRFNLGPTKKEAYRRYHELMAQRPQPKLCAGSVVALLDEFLDWCDKHVAPATFEWYRSRLQEFVTTLPVGLQVTQLVPFHVTKWIDGHAHWSGGSRRNACRSVQRAMKWAVEQGLIERSPVAHLKKPRGGKRDRIVPPDEFERILGMVADPAFRDLLITTWETGCRPQESLRVEARHVELDNSRWVLPAGEAKGEYLRVVYLPERAREITRRLTGCHPEGPLFRNSRGMPWTTDAVNCVFQRIQLQMGLRRMQGAGVEIDEREVQKLAKELRSKRLVEGESARISDRALLGEARRKLTRQLAKQHAPKYSLYTLRHSWATHALQRGVDALTVAILMGHQDPSTLARVYQHLSLNPQHLLEQACRAAG